MSNLEKFFREWFIHDLDESADPEYYGYKDIKSDWYLLRISDTGTRFQYASIKNNPSISSYSTAWTDRASLTYGDINEAY